MQYFNWVEFLLKELELRIELEHLMSMLEWVAAFNESFETGLASNHQIFSDATLTTEVATKTISLLGEEGEGGRDTEVVHLNESRHELNRGTIKVRKSVKFSPSTDVAAAAKEEE